MTSRRTIYTELVGNILPLKGYYELGLCKFIYRTMNGSLRSNLNFKHASHDHDTRQRNHIRLPQIATGFGERRISFVGARLFNELPSTIRQTRNVRTFKLAAMNYFAQTEQIARYINY